MRPRRVRRMRPLRCEKSRTARAKLATKTRAYARRLRGGKR